MFIKFFKDSCILYVIHIKFCCVGLFITENILIRNWEIVWKHGPYCWHFRLNLKYLEWPYGEYIKTAKNGAFCGELLSENDFEAVLATFYCYDYGANASEAVQKTPTGQKEYLKKCFLCVIVRLNSQNVLINNREKSLVTRIPLT